ncbi:hypothetical protein UFOVP1615_25 [uncultured Caudovirales phage]|uniref:Uncharacterized protein n=1 Tax=uncultured Caudovirales phage TaxID=2100421 RepID=A0A6J5SWB7_9CAUD|nr:hypothetical protein UFOVP1615_25 [uncultured Caudovirales phage]
MMEKIFETILRIAVIAIPIGVIVFIWACVFYVIAHI